MTRQVALAEATYARLKRQKMPGESFSQAIERLLDHQPKDPLRFLDHAHKQTMTAQELLDLIAADREATRGP